MLVGRDAELEELCAAATAALGRGRGLLALVCGEAGIGKTRLATEVAERLADGVAVAWAACRPDGGAPPYWPWTQLLSRLGRQDALVTDEAGSPDLARFALFETVAAAVGAAAPVLLVLDDLHWADLPSLRLLDALGAHVGPAPVLVLGTYRDTEPGAAALAGIAADRRLVLRGLAVADLGGALAEATGETVAPDTVAALHRRTGGNPFFAAEVVRLRRAEGSAVAAVPVSVRAVLDRRLDRLPPVAETVLRAAAVLDPATTAGVDTVLLAGVAGVAAVAVPELLAPAVEAGLVVAETPGAGRYRLAHALVADTLAARTPTAQQLALHRAAAALLGRRVDAGVGDAAEAAHQQLAAARLSGHPDEARTAAERCAAAARTAVERTAYEDAVGRLQDALAVLAGVPGGPDRGALLCALGEAALAAGDPAEARRAFAEAAARARRHAQPELLAAAALGLTGGAAGFEVDLGDPDRVAPLEQALAALPDADSGLRSAVAARLSVALAFTAGEPRRRALADTAVAMARRLGDPRALAVALAARCDALAGPDHVAARERMAGEIVTAARSAGDRTLELLGRRLQVVALAEAGRWPQVDLAIDAYARVAEPLRMPGLTWYVPLWRGARATMRGDRAAEDEYRAHLRHRVERSGSGNAELLALTQRFVREVPAGRGFDVGFDAGFARFMQLSPDIAATAAQGTTALLRALSGEADARGLLHSSLAAHAGEPRDSEWLPERVQAAMTAVLVGDRAAAERRVLGAGAVRRAVRGRGHPGRDVGVRRCASGPTRAPARPRRGGPAPPRGGVRAGCGRRCGVGCTHRPMGGGGGRGGSEVTAPTGTRPGRRCSAATARCGPSPTPVARSGCATPRACATSPRCSRGPAGSWPSTSWSEGRRRAVTGSSRPTGPRSRPTAVGWPSWRRTARRPRRTTTRSGSSGRPRSGTRSWTSWPPSPDWAAARAGSARTRADAQGRRQPDPPGGGSHRAGPPGAGAPPSGVGAHRDVLPLRTGPDRPLAVVACTRRAAWHRYIRCGAQGGDAVRAAPTLRSLHDHDRHPDRPRPRRALSRGGGRPAGRPPVRGRARRLRARHRDPRGAARPLPRARRRRRRHRAGARRHRRDRRPLRPRVVRTAGRCGVAHRRRPAA